MGNKGDKLSAESVIATELLLEKLHSIKGVTSKKMFGGHGLFHNSKMFGLIDSKGQSFLKVDDTNRADFELKDAHRHSRMPYFSIPNEIIVDTKELKKWVEKSIEISKK